MEKYQQSQCSIESSKVNKIIYHLMTTNKYFEYSNI